MSDTSKTVEPGTVKSLIKLYWVQKFFGGLGLLIHFYTTWLAYKQDGVFWSIVHFLLYIYAEFYWAYKMWMLEGLNAYSLIAGIWAVVYVTILIITVVRTKMSGYERWMKAD